MKQKDHVLFNDPFPVFLDYHRDYLWNFLEKLRNWKGFPDSLDLRFFNDKLITDGWAPVLMYPGKGLICLDGAISGVDHYYRKTMLETANAVLKSVKRKISYIDAIDPKGCCVCYNTCDYRSPQPMTNLVEVYAYKLAQADVSTVVSLENSRATLIPAVSDKESAIRVTEALKDIYAGKPATIAYKNSFSNNSDFQMIPIKARDNLITSDLTDTKRQIMAEFLSRLGINVTSVDKKERVLEAEATANNQELYINSRIFMEPAELFCDEVNRTFGLSTSCEVNGEAVASFMEGGYDDGESNREPDIDNEPAS